MGSEMCIRDRIYLYDNKRELSPIHIASAFSRDSLLEKCLIDNGSYINNGNKQFGTPLYMACQNGHFSTVKLLLDNGADVRLCSGYKGSPLHAASANGHESTVRLLLDKGADVNSYSKFRGSPLNAACKNGHESTVSYTHLTLPTICSV